MPDVFVKAGVPTGTMLEIAMVLTAVSSRDTSFTVVEMQVLHYHVSGRLSVVVWERRYEVVVLVFAMLCV